VTSSLGAVGWLVLLYPGQKGPGSGQRVALRLSDDPDPGRVASRLAEAGVIQRPWVFAAYLRVRGAESKLRQGSRVVLTDDLAPRELLRRVARGYGPSHVRVTIPEGFTRFDIAERLQWWGICDAQGFVEVTESDTLKKRLDITAPTLEGYLFPATYELAQYSKPRAVAERMVDAWRRRVKPLLKKHAQGQKHLERDLDWGVAEVMTLASIVEKEAAVAEERPIIAGVFLNRLRSDEFEPKRLQADPTVAYGCLEMPEDVTSCDQFDGGVTRAMTRDGDNPYNTYRTARLPPGPIANPGVDSIEAVLEPAQHDYFYFVASGDGRHHFSTTHEEHLEAVARYRD
jgi:UPF0755 protein